MPLAAHGSAYVFDTAMLEAMQVAMVFATCGRKSDIGGSVDYAAYSSYRRDSRAAYDAYSREAGVADACRRSCLAALEAMRAQAQAQVDAAQEQMQAKKLERVDKAVRHDRRLKRVTNYKMAEDAKRSAKNIIQPDATWKLQKRLKERKLGAEKERRRAVRNIYEGGAQREAERCAKRDAARKKRWEQAMVKNEEEVKLPSREEIMKIAEERTRRA